MTMTAINANKTLPSAPVGGVIASRQWFGQMLHPRILAQTTIIVDGKLYTPLRAWETPSKSVKHSTRVHVELMDVRGHDDTINISGYPDEKFYILSSILGHTTNFNDCNPYNEIADTETVRFGHWLMNHRFGGSYLITEEHPGSHDNLNMVIMDDDTHKIVSVTELEDGFHELNLKDVYSPQESTAIVHENQWLDFVIEIREAAQ